MARIEEIIIRASDGDDLVYYNRRPRSRAWLWIAVGIFIVWMIGGVGAQPANCLAVRDSDARQECIAVQRNDASGCTSIRNPDDRERCRQRAARR